MQRDARNSPQHTPGPWFEDEAGICAADRLVAIIALPEEFFGVDPDSLPATVTAELAANAALIAAAPDFIEPVKALLEPWEAYSDEKLRTTFAKILLTNAEHYIALRAAISRATGEVQS